jgi:hypothetical protein
MAKKSQRIRLKPGVSIGQPAAEEDTRFLSECFLKHPIVDALKDVSSPQCLLLGRTGSGKSAILWHLDSTLGNVSRLDPKEVAFQHIGNSAIIRHLSEIGVELHVFYEYLWTHVLTLHFIRECLGVKSRDGLGRTLESIRKLVRRDEKRALVLRYLENNADSFWNTVEQVSAEFTNAVAGKLAAEANLSAALFRSKLEAGGEWKDEQKRLFKYRAQEIVSSLQMRELKEAINALADTVDPKNAYYVLIDDLDRDWVGDEKTQYALIRALIDCLNTFRRVPQLKIIVAMREDLYECTLRTKTDKHFQAEKQEGIIKRLRWNDSMLTQLVDLRIQELFRHGYTKQNVSLKDVLPEMVGQTVIRPYLIQRTLRRPRDIIAFVNRILGENEGNPLPLPARSVTKAEPGYSNERMRALEDEWRSCHPLIRTYLQALQGLAGAQTIDALDEERLFTLIVEVDDFGRAAADEVEAIAKSVYDRNKELKLKRLAQSLVATLYKVGVLGVKLHANQSYCFCYEQRASIDDTEITEAAKFVIHPMLATSLGSHALQADAA